MKVLGIIPARAGSKGVPGKNIRMFGGKPLIAYSIETGQNSTALAELVVSTEDEEIDKVAKEYKCRVIPRSQQFASDTSNVVDAVLETLQRLENENLFFDAVLLLQPTAPLRTGKDVDKAIELLKNGTSNAVISMVSVEDKHPARMYKIEGDKATCEMPEFETARRQDLPQRYIRNGCIYLIKTTTLKKERTFMPISKSAYIMDSNWAVNIDTELDVVILNTLIQEWNKHQQ